MRLFLILLAVPVIEIALFIEVGGWLGTWPTVGIVILTALIGSILLRRQGLAAMRDFQGRLTSGEDPGMLLAEGAMILFAGALLLTPGFFTDAVGFSMLIPAVRKALWAWGRRHIRVASVHAGASQGPSGGGGSWTYGRGGETVDGVYSEVDQNPPRSPDNPRALRHD